MKFAGKVFALIGYLALGFPSFYAQAFVRHDALIDEDAAALNRAKRLK